jgi:hypothetical protein
VSTVQANSSALFALLLFVLCLLGVIAVLFYSSTNSPLASRRKPKRTPKKPLLEQIEDAFAGFIPWLSAFFQNPVVLLMESNLIQNLSLSPEQPPKKSHRPPSSSWVSGLMKTGAIIFSFIWNFILGVMVKTFQPPAQEMDGPKGEVKGKSESAENTEVLPTSKPVEPHRVIPPTPPSLVLPMVEVATSVLDDAPKPQPLRSVTPKSKSEPSDRIEKSSSDNFFTDSPQREKTISDCDLPKVPPQLPIRIQTKKERRSEKMKKSSFSEMSKDIQETTTSLPSGRSESEEVSQPPFEALSESVSMERLESPIEIVEAPLPNDQLPLQVPIVFEISEPSPHLPKEPLLQGEVKTPDLNIPLSVVLLPSLSQIPLLEAPLLNEISQDEVPLPLTEEEAPVDEAPLQNSLESPILAGALLNDSSCFQDADLLLAPQMEQIAEITSFPPPGFLDASHRDFPRASSRFSLLADLNESSEVFVEPGDLPRIDAIGGTLASRSRAVGFTDSPQYDGQGEHESYGGNPFYSGDVDWSQPFFEAVVSENENLGVMGHFGLESAVSLGNEHGSHGVDVGIDYSQSVFPTPTAPSSQYPPGYDMAQSYPQQTGTRTAGGQWFGDEYSGYSYSSQSPSQSQYSYQQQGSPAAYPNSGASRRPSASNSSHGPRQSQLLPASRSAIPSSWMHPQVSALQPPNWQYYAQHPFSIAPTLSSPETQFSPSVKITFTVRTRLLSPSRVAQVKVLWCLPLHLLSSPPLPQIVSSIFGWSITDALAMKRSTSTPGLWGVSLDIPREHLRLAYLYLALDVNGRIWVESSPPRIIDFGNYGFTNEINQEDSFDRGSQSIRDTFHFPEG